MARVNHKIVKQRLNEKRSKITDKQFFSSRILAGHFEDIAAAQTRRYNYNRRVRVSLFWKPKDEFTAVTDNQSIRINCGHPMVTKVRGRENRYHVVCGMFAHELGHVLYTDFLAGQTHSNYFGSYRWFPEAPLLKTTSDIKNENAMWSYAAAASENIQWIQYIAHSISNVLEDGYIENRILVNFPGSLGYGLEFMRDKHFKMMPTVTEMIEQEEEGDRHIFESINQIILSYAKFGEIKYGEEPLSDERIQIVFGLLEDIDKALTNHSGKERLKATNIIMVRCWNYIEEFLELCKTRQKEALSAGEASDASDIIKKTLGAAIGSSTIGDGDGTPVSASAAEKDISATAASRAKTQSDAESESGDENASGSQTDLENEDSTSESGDETSINAKNGEGKQETSENEGERIPFHQTESISEPLGGTTERDDEYVREPYSNAASDIERVLDKMAEKAACKELENERTQELNDVAKNISYGNIHSGVHIRVKRIADVDEELVDQYNIIADPLLNISRQLQKSLTQKLKEERRCGKQTNLLMGRRLNSRALCRNDGKVFYKNTLPNEIPELAVGLLLDESGSMRCSDRCTYARASAIILYDFCQGLDIPVMVYGHSTGYDSIGDTVYLYSYAEFESFDNDDKYRMMDICARGGNRDGAALRFVAEQLSKRPEPVKILILVSDGQPADTGYGGTAAEEDLRGIQREYEKKGILFISAAIGDDKESIERIYGDAFMDITDLSQLPVKLTSVVKRHIKA